MRIPWGLWRKTQDAAANNPHPLMGVPCGHSVHQYIVKVRIHSARRHGDQTTIFALHFSAQDIVHRKVGRWMWCKMPDRR